RGLEFVIAGSNASKAMSFRFTGDDVTNPESYTAITVIDEEDFFNIVPGGIRVYGLDMADDMDGDGIAELVFTRGSTRGGDGAPGVFIAEFEPLVTAPGLPEKIQQIKNVKAGLDLDQDGKQEFMFPMVYLNAADEKKRAVYVYEAVADDDYALVWSYEFPGMGDQFTTVDVSDLDGDGNEEILAVHVPEEGDNGPNLYVFEWDGTDNGYGTAPTVTWDLGSAGRDVVRVAKAADLDGDGKQEVVLTSFQTQPAIVIASVSNFDVPVWTSEYINNEVGGTAPDIAAIGIGNMDTNGRPEVILTEGASDQLLIIEWSGTQYNMNAIALPAGKSVSVHGVDVGDADGDGRDEAYIANLQGNVYVLSGEGDAITFTASDLYTIAETEEQWLEASTGSFSGRGLEFVIAGSNASKVVSYQFTGDDVTNPESYTAITVIDEEDFFNIVPGGIRVYGLDMADDMDGDGIAELVFTRGSTRGGDGAPGVFIVEFEPNVDVDELTSGIPDDFKLLQNYPNPFNPTTQINYSVSRPGNVDISVFNVLGQKVCTLVDGYHNVNYYTVQWNATNDNGFQVPSGIYFYRMETNESSLMKRMLLMR
ncbi:MAG: T9SS type A sorting domain-containing protein, partial [Candidatus Marinimicrobia bacterium]|nr:T9SS type A sorting domain-containing protein [Candidatus Neomarinimicrobiota bacterium]